MIRSHLALVVMLGFISSLAMAKTDDFNEFSSTKGSKAKIQRVKVSPGELRMENKSAAKSSYMNYLPFGAGQFAQDKTWLGAGLAATQAGSLLLYFERMTALDKANKDADSAMKAASPQEYSSSSSLYKYLSTNEKYVQSTRQEAQLLMLSFIGLYTIGLVDALYDPFDSAAFGRSKRTKNSATDKTPPQADRSGITKQDLFKSDLSFVIMPHEQKLGFGLSMTSAH